MGRFLLFLIIVTAAITAAAIYLPRHMDLTPEGGRLLLADDLATRGAKRSDDEQLQENTPTYRALRAVVNSKGVRRFALDETYAYLYDATCEVIVVPEGFLTDFASIPGAARALFNPADYAEASLVHDWLYAVGTNGDEQARKKADEVFRAMLKETAFPGWKVTAMYRSVRMGGKKGFGLAGDFAFWDFTARQQIDNRAMPAKLYYKLDEISDAVAARFGDLSSGSCQRTAQTPS